MSSGQTFSRHWCCCCLAILQSIELHYTENILALIKALDRNILVCFDCYLKGDCLKGGVIKAALSFLWVNMYRF